MKLLPIFTVNNLNWLPINFIGDELFSQGLFEMFILFSPVNLGIFEAQHQTNCNIIVFNAIYVRVAYL